MKKNKLIPASEYCKSVFDGTHNTPKPCTEGHKLLTSKNILNGELDKSNAYYISEEDYNAINIRSKVHQDDILFSMIGSVGNVCLIKDNDSAIDFAIKNMGVFSCGEKEKAVFLYYYLQSPFAKKTIESYLNGAVQKFLGLECLRTFPVPEYSDDMKKIATVLSALDDKIALNRQMNAKLEQMAKRLYEHWFVQFDFPNADGKPYKSSGGKMVWNEELKREIPEGWEVKSLGEVCDFPIERFSDKDISEKLYVPIEVIPRYEMSFSETANIEKAASGLCSFTKRSILLSNRRVYFHKVCIAPFEGITRDTVIIINSKDLNNLGFIYQIVNSNHFIDYATLNSYGSEQPVLSTPTVQDYKFVFPNNGIDKIYSKRVDSIINKVLENNLEIRKLTALHNRVLPLLMNGQVQI